MPVVKAPSKRSQLSLVAKINRLYKPGDKIRVAQDDDSIAVWTLTAPANVLPSGTAIIWCAEKGSCYNANRVELVRSCRSCGCCDRDCIQCIDAQGYPCHWVEDFLCSRCKAEQEAASHA